MNHIDLKSIGKHLLTLTFLLFFSMTTTMAQSNCCAPNGGTGCNNAACEASVCGADSFCCNVLWDSLCAGAAAADPNCAAAGCFVAPPSPPTVPTLGQWGIILFTLLLLTMGAVAVLQRQMATVGGTGSLQSRFLPFDKKRYLNMLAMTTLAVFAIFATAINAFGYELTGADVPGSLMAIPILAYLLHLAGFGKK